MSFPCYPALAEATNATELAVGARLDADSALEVDNILDRLVLGDLELLLADLPGVKLLAQLEKCGGTCGET